jgi:hypothetical protein
MYFGVSDRVFWCRDIYEFCFVNGMGSYVNTVRSGDDYRIVSQLRNTRPTTYAIDVG